MSAEHYGINNELDKSFLIDARPYQMRDTTKSPIYLVTDDAKFFITITGEYDQRLLQEVMNNLFIRPKGSLLSFNPQKPVRLTLSTKNS